MEQCHFPFARLNQIKTTTNVFEQEHQNDSNPLCFFLSLSLSLSLISLCFLALPSSKQLNEHMCARARETEWKKNVCGEEKKKNNVYMVMQAKVNIFTLYIRILLDLSVCLLDWGFCGREMYVRHSGKIETKKKWKPT